MSDPTPEPSHERIDFEQFVEASIRAVTRALEAREIEGRPVGPEESLRMASGKTGPITIGIMVEPPSRELE